MNDGINLVMLVCAILAALAFGVLLGYACCMMLFSALRTHVRSLPAEPSKVKPQIAGI